MLPASMIQTGLRPPFGSHRPPHEKIASLSAPPSAHVPESIVRIPQQKVYVGEIHDAVMPRGPLWSQCSSRQAVRFGKRKGVRRYRCKACTRTLTDLTGTLLHGLRRRDLWLDFCRCLMERLSVGETASELGISKNTAFARRHRAISAFASADSTVMCEGIVEPAQWPMPHSFKGSPAPAEVRMDSLKSAEILRLVSSLGSPCCREPPGRN